MSFWTEVLLDWLDWAELLVPPETPLMLPGVLDEPELPQVEPPDDPGELLEEPELFSEPLRCSLLVWPEFTVDCWSYVEDDEPATCPPAG